MLGQPLPSSQLVWWHPGSADLCSQVTPARVCLQVRPLKLQVPNLIFKWQISILLQRRGAETQWKEAGMDLEV